MREAAVSLFDDVNDELGDLAEDPCGAARGPVVDVCELAGFIVCACPDAECEDEEGEVTECAGDARESATCIADHRNAVCSTLDGTSVDEALLECFEDV